MGIVGGLLVFIYGLAMLYGICSAMRGVWRQRQAGRLVAARFRTAKFCPKCGHPMNFRAKRLACRECGLKWSFIHEGKS